MHGRLHPASISTREAATSGGARATAVVHVAAVGRRSVGRRDGRLHPAFALPSNPSTREISPRVLAYILSRCHVRSLLRPLTHALVARYLVISFLSINRYCAPICLLFCPAERWIKYEIHERSIVRKASPGFVEVPLNLCDT